MGWRGVTRAGTRPGTLCDTAGAPCVRATEEVSKHGWISRKRGGKSRVGTEWVDVLRCHPERRRDGVCRHDWGACSSTAGTGTAGAGTAGAGTAGAGTAGTGTAGGERADTHAGPSSIASIACISAGSASVVVKVSIVGVSILESLATSVFAIVQVEPPDDCDAESTTIAVSLSIKIRRRMT